MFDHDLAPGEILTVLADALATEAHALVVTQDALFVSGAQRPRSRVALDRAARFHAAARILERLRDMARQADRTGQRVPKMLTDAIEDGRGVLLCDASNRGLIQPRERQPVRAAGGAT